MNEKKDYTINDFKKVKINDYKVIFNFTYIQEFLNIVKNKNITLIDYECFQMFGFKNKLDPKRYFSELKNIPFLVNCKTIHYDESNQLFKFDKKITYYYSKKLEDEKIFYKEVFELAIQVKKFYNKHFIDTVLVMGKDTEIKFSHLANQHLKVKILKESLELWDIFNWNRTTHLRINGLNNYFSLNQLLKSLPIRKDNIISGKEIANKSTQWFTTLNTIDAKIFFHKAIDHVEYDLEKGLYLLNWLNKLLYSKYLQNIDENEYFDNKSLVNIWDF
ncbi:hypothetical protein SGLAD_v1c00970 [Spiroplasma gladiatoris]|uniref:Uncharacterized protein n=1 Tax=Spiroplasma gladiatoris TaxID=2143 RepID=A0A4P7AHY4_9MOLU|nr:hypothetical protein [Spiroplasma gladiatoris]QBQ07298.1 hypothetical protein SGLAD_v1c00970 [Spiroplasma gladiatoris]